MFDKDIKDAVGDFVVWKEGEPVIGCVQGDTREYFVVWENSKPTEVEEGTLDSKGKQAKARFIVNLWNAEAKKFQLLEQGVSVYRQFKDLKDAGYDLQKTMVKLSRTGSTMNDTEYTVLPMPGGDLSDEALAEIQSHELMPLTKPVGE